MEDEKDFCLPGMSGQFCQNLLMLKRVHVFERLVSIPHGEFMTMSVLKHEMFKNHKEGMRVSELAGVLKNTPAASSRMLSTLEEKGYIERFFDNKDRRNTYVKLTEKGSETVYREYLRIRDYMLELQRQLGKENCAKFLELQKRTIDITEKYLQMLEEKEE